jgi:hypothetical protein
MTARRTNRQDPHNRGSGAGRTGKNDAGAGAVMLGVGGLALLVVALVKAGNWYDGWQQIAQLDPELAERRMLRAARGVLSVLSLAVAAAGAGVGIQGWRSMQSGRFPPSPGRPASLTGDDARRFGAALLGLSVFGALAVIASTWLVGWGLAERAVVKQIHQVHEQSIAAQQPYMIPAPPSAQNVVDDPVQSEADDLRDQLLLHCMPDDRELCSAAIKSKLRRWLWERLSDGATCADLANELSVPQPGIEPWCGQFKRQLKRAGSENL